MKLIRKTVALIFAIAMIYSCGNPDSSIELAINTNLLASGPLFEGSNTYQSEVDNKLTAILAENNISMENVDNIMLESCKIKSDEKEELSIIQSCNLQLFSDNFPMQSVAVINPFTHENGEATLKIADVQENIFDILKESKCYVVADASIKEDYDYDMELSCEMIFKINYYKN